MLKSNNQECKRCFRKFLKKAQETFLNLKVLKTPKLESIMKTIQQTQAHLNKTLVVKKPI